MKRVGLVILNYNDSGRTIELLDKIAEYNVWCKIVVVDNKSTDNSVEILKKHTYDNVDVIESEKNGGYSYGNNYGAKYLIDHYNVDICIIANPDVQVTEEVIYKMVNGIENEGYSAVAPIMLDKDGNYTSRSYRHKGFYQDVWDYLIPIHFRKKNESFIMSADASEIVAVQMIPGSLFAISTEALKKINYLDEDVFLYCEERILAERLRCQNLQLGLLKNQSFVHLHVDSQDYVARIRQMERVNRARMYYYNKYQNIGMIKSILLKGTMTWHMFWYKRYIRKSGIR